MVAKCFSFLTFDNCCIRVEWTGEKIPEILGLFQDVGGLAKEVFHIDLSFIEFVYSFIWTMRLAPNLHEGFEYYD